MSIGRDPKGFYVILEIEDDADVVTIKAAFRTKAKRLHPDFNPSPIAAKQFNRLHEAYATLIDPRKRTAYDRPWKHASAKRADGPIPDPKPQPQSEPRAQARAAEPSPEKPERATPQPSAPEPPRRVKPDTPVICQCGLVTAQPRYIVFDMVWGRGRRVQRHHISGVFCRACADRAAVRASLVTWAAGWWAWPNGPRETVSAILNNVRGGRTPGDRNARLLMRQARAFKTRGEIELARNAAHQARIFVRAPEVRREVESMIASLGPLSGRVLKNRWRRTGWAPTLQMMPLALFGAIVAVSVTLSLSGQPSRAVPVIKTDPAPVAASPAKPAKPAPRPFTVTSETAQLRTGPNEVFEVLATLARGDHVTSLEADPSGAWLRVMRSDGLIGFVAAAQVRPAD